MEFEGRRYRAMIGSDVMRDGMYLEVSGDGSDPVLEIFYDDLTGSMSLTAFRTALPLPLIEWAIQQAHERLVPNNPDRQKLAGNSGG